MFGASAEGSESALVKISTWNGAVQSQMGSLAVAMAALLRKTPQYRDRTLIGEFGLHVLPEARGQRNDNIKNVKTKMLRQKKGLSGF